MQNLAQLLGKKYKSELKYCRAVEVIESNWPSLFKDLSQFIQPKNIYYNQLVIECNNSAWLSEIDYFKDEIVSKVNALLIQKNISIKLNGIKPLLNSNMISKFNDKKDTCLPELIEDRIQFLVEEKKKKGATLCKSCKKIWDISEICRLCQLTSD
tara:strand:- start:485 stop:949 length:465 start_codon:yes stop_codon:yes gene_type:complete